MQKGKQSNEKNNNSLAIKQSQGHLVPRQGLCGEGNGTLL